MSLVQVCNQVTVLLKRNAIQEHFHARKKQNVTQEHMYTHLKAFSDIIFDEVLLVVSSRFGA